MRQKSLHYLFLFVMLGIGFTGCKSDVDLSNLNVDSKVNARVSIPLGEISTTFGDLIGLIPNSSSNIRIGENGMIELFVDQHYTREYHAIDLTEYLGTTESEKFILPMIGSPLIPAGMDTIVPFDMTIKFDGVNNPASINSERLDSMLIEQARFTTKVVPADFAIKDEDIEKVVMVLGQQFRRAKGTEIELPNFRLNEDVSIIIDDFTLVMMEDETLPPSFDNVVQQAEVWFDVYLKAKNNIIVTPTSSLHFSFKVEMMEYSALFGFFGAGDMTKDSDLIAIPLDIPGGEPMVLPVKEPEIKMLFTYGLSMPLQVELKELATISSDGTKSHATWNGNNSTVIQLENVLPVNAPLNAVVTDSSILLDNTAAHGAIDKMFLKDVKELAYNYKLDVDTQRVIDGKVMNQFRLTKNTQFDLDLHVNVPMEFNKGLKVAYTDTIKDVNLERASLDSLSKMTGDILKVDSAEAYLVLTINNEIPVALELDATLLDDKNNAIALDSFKGIAIKGATYDSATNSATDAVTVHTIGIHTEDFEELAKTKSIKLRTRIGDDQNPSSFLADKKLTIKMLVTADVQAAINLSVKTTNK